MFLNLTSFILQYGFNKSYTRFVLFIWQKVRNTILTIKTI